MYVCTFENFSFLVAFTISSGFEVCVCVYACMHASCVCMYACIIHLSLSSPKPYWHAVTRLVHINAHLHEHVAFLQQLLYVRLQQGRIACTFAIFCLQQAQALAQSLELPASVSKKKSFTHACACGWFYGKQPRARLS
jgi:hypothetical protein